MNGDGETEVHHVVAGLLVEENRVLLCHRSAHRRWYPDVWDLPGGHIESGETPPEALARELHEEIGVVVPAPVGPALARLRGPGFDCRIWVVSSWDGTPHLTSDEHDAMRWWLASEVSDLPLADDRYRQLLVQAIAHEP